MIYKQGFANTVPEADARVQALAGYRQACAEFGHAPADQPDVSILCAATHEAAGEYLVRVATPGAVAEIAPPVAGLSALAVGLDRAAAVIAARPTTPTGA